MLASWDDVFAHAGYTAEELNEATSWMVTHNPPRFRTDHLAAITARIRDRRTVNYRRDDAGVEPSEERGTCSLCGGTGRVVVPHPQGIACGEWVPMRTTRALAMHYTAVVICRCPLGKWVASRISDSDKRPGRLDDYERMNPRWQLQLESRHRELLARADLVPASKEWRATMRQLLAKYGLRFDEESFEP